VVSCKRVSGVHLGHFWATAEFEFRTFQADDAVAI
jgi:hypothetical protein